MGVTRWWRRITGKDTKDDKGATVRAQPSGGGRTRPASAGVAQPKGKPGTRPELDPSLAVMGVEARKDGWVGAVLDPSGQGTPHFLTGRTVADLVEQAGALAVVGVAVPIGLPDDSRREADAQTRRFLGSRGSSVFTTPVRDAVYAASFGEANALNRERLGAGISQQAYGLRSRIIEVDAWLRQDLPFVLVEVHPEASFASMAGVPLESRKRSGEGSDERRRVLAGVGIYVPGTIPVGVSVEDALDACAAAWSAHRVKTGEARTFPDPPETFSDGVRAAVHV